MPCVIKSVWQREGISLLDGWLIMMAPWGVVGRASSLLLRCLPVASSIILSQISCTFDNVHDAFQNIFYSSQNIIQMFSSFWSLSNLQYFLYYFLNHYFTFVKTVIPNAQQFTKLMQYFFSRTKACKFWTFFSYNAYLNVSILTLSLKACILFAFHTSLNLYVM